MRSDYIGAEEMRENYQEQANVVTKVLNISVCQY